MSHIIVFCLVFCGQYEAERETARTWVRRFWRDVSLSQRGFMWIVQT